MARIRTVKPEFWTDEKVVALSPYARLLFIGLLNFADDCGHVENEPIRLKLQILPADEVNARELVDELLTAGLLRDLDKCLLIPNFLKHQAINRPSTCRFGLLDDSGDIAGDISDNSVSPPEKSSRNGREGNGNGMERKKPSREVVKDDPLFNKFWENYPFRNGKVGKQPARKEWAKLDLEERREAVEALSTYAEVTNGFAKDAERYLKGKLWDGLELSSGEDSIAPSSSDAIPSMKEKR